VELERRWFGEERKGRSKALEYCTELISRVEGANVPIRAEQNSAAFNWRRRTLDEEQGMQKLRQAN
jgi:hypothetical protein